MQVFIFQSLFMQFLNSSYFNRSGSSLVGSILSANPSIAYMYEPFHQNVFHYPNGTEVNLQFVKPSMEFISNYTNDLFDCKHVTLYIFQSYNCFDTNLFYIFNFFYSLNQSNQEIKTGLLVSKFNLHIHKCKLSFMIKKIILQ